MLDFSFLVISNLSGGALSPGSSVLKNLPAKGDLGLIPASGRSPAEGNGNPLQYSYLGNPIDRGAWLATVREVTKRLDTTERVTTAILSSCYNFVLNKLSLVLYPCGVNYCNIGYKNPPLKSYFNISTYIRALSLPQSLNYRIYLWPP